MASMSQDLLQRCAQYLGDAWRAITSLQTLASQAGAMLYLVGGSVRDCLLDINFAHRDIDLAIEGASPLDIATQAAATYGGTSCAAPAFITAKWQVSPTCSIDITKARRETYAHPGALPDVVAADIWQDMWRRDVSCHAMAIALNGPQKGLLIDPCGGTNDLQQRILRILHPASLRDDPTRILRIARFAARLDFKIEATTQRLMHEAINNNLLQYVSLYRWGHELDLLWLEKNYLLALQQLNTWHFWQALHPVFKTYNIGHALQQDMSFIDTIKTTDIPWLIFANAIPQQHRKSLETLAFGNTHRKQRFLYGPERVLQAIHALIACAPNDYASLPDILKSLDDTERAYMATHKLLTNHHHATALLHVWQTTGRFVRTVVDGDMLMSWGFRPGPVFKIAIKAALAIALQGGNPAMQQHAARDVLKAHGT